MIYEILIKTTKTHDELETIIKKELADASWCFSYPSNTLQIDSPDNILDKCQKIVDTEGYGEINVWTDLI